MLLGSDITVAVVWAGNCSSDSTPSLGTSICSRCGPKRQAKERRKEGRKEGGKEKERKRKEEK